MYSKYITKAKFESGTKKKTLNVISLKKFVSLYVNQDRSLLCIISHAQLPDPVLRTERGEGDALKDVRLHET